MALTAVYTQSPHKERVTQRERDANDFQWYKDKINLVNSSAYGSNFYMGYGGITDYKRKKVNYDLFNNIINKADFEYVCQPYGSQAGELPAQMTNRDIVSGKIKALLGMEMKMPFSWNVIATNEQATTRREKEEFDMYRQYVISEIMGPIQADARKAAMAQAQGRQLTPEEQQQLEQQIQSEVEAKTPDEVRKYMHRDHQDPAEVQAQQIINYLLLKERVAEKFNKGFKHSLLTGEEIYRVDIINGEPALTVINPLYFDYDKSPDLDYIDEGEWARCEYRMTPSEIVRIFGSQMTDDQIDRVYEFQNNWASPTHIDFSFAMDRNDNASTVIALHTVWKSLRKIGFRYYKDRNGDEQMDIVDENYRLNKMIGDVRIEWEWIPETHEGWRILDDIFVYCRPVPGQMKDIDTIYDCHLPYYGAVCDNLNSPVTAIMDRMKSYQYYYNIIMYRIELLMASDKGKILAANINAIPKTAGIDIQKFMYFMEANKIAFFNPNEEGNRGSGSDVTNLVKEIDMSLASSINEYIQLAEWISVRCGQSVGITPAMEGAIGPNEAVTNTRQNLVQSSHIIQPYFELHNNVKGRVLQALMDSAKVAYTQGQPRKLNYVLDDLSQQMLSIDQEVLDYSTYGVFISNSSKASEAKSAVESLAQAALQNQQADLVDIIKIIRSESINEAIETLEASMDKRNALNQQQAQADQEAKAQMQREAQAQQQREWAHDKDMVITKETERRKTEIQKQTILSLGFNQEKDMDRDGTPDVLEVAKFGVDAQIKQRQLDLDERALDQKTDHDTEKLEVERAKIAAIKKRNTN